MVIIAINHF